MVKKSLAEGYLSKNTTDNGVFDDDNNEEDEAFTFAKVSILFHGPDRIPNQLDTSCVQGKYALYVDGLKTIWFLWASGKIGLTSDVALQA